ncbi:MAG TPA: alpha/beta fold hydrolase [Gemmataceae bacterium]|nr:alpha/beta fold hydrolase [Gemmataceae bacterium]
MAQKLQCDDCGCRFDPDPEDAGARRVRCPECGAMVRVRAPRGKPGGSGKKWVIAIVLIVVLLGLGCCGGLAGLVWYAIRPTSFPEQTADYADARKTFKTKLTSNGPAPQSWKQEVAPPGVSEVTYNSGGLRLKAWVNRPQPGGPAKPAVLFLHGGFAFGADDWVQCQPFRDAGFVTMTPWLRGENGQQGSYTMFYDEVDDVVAAAEVLSATPGVDPNRVYVAGHSAGGTLAMLGAMTTKRFKACASFSGSPDQVKFLQGNEDLARFDRSDFNELVMRSPLAFPKSFKCPARLYWGDEEWGFKFSTQRLAKFARAAGQDVQAIEVPGDHMSAVDPAMPQVVSFFQQVK